MGQPTGKQVFKECFFYSMAEQRMLLSHKQISPTRNRTLNQACRIQSSVLRVTLITGMCKKDIFFTLQQ
jgi:hypothetical protein